MYWKHYAKKWRRKYAPGAVTLTREQMAAYIFACLMYHNATTAKKLLMELEVR